MRHGDRHRRAVDRRRPAAPDGGGATRAARAAAADGAGRRRRPGRDGAGGGDDGVDRSTRRPGLPVGVDGGPDGVRRRQRRPSCHADRARRRPVGGGVGVRRARPRSSCWRSSWCPACCSPGARASAAAPMSRARRACGCAGARSAARRPRSPLARPSSAARRRPRSRRTTRRRTPQTKTLTREHVDGRRHDVDGRHARRSPSRVDRTAEPARPRARSTVSWTGAQPERRPGRHPYGEQRAATRSTRSSSCSAAASTTRSLPADQQLRPETCWTVHVPAALRQSRVATAEPSGGTTATPTDERPRGPEPARRGPPECGAAAGTGSSRSTCCRSWPRTARSTRRARDATIAAGGGRRRGASRRPRSPRSPTSTAPATVQFEVRTDVENESLGCSDDVPCSIVVIPIMGISCAGRATPSLPQGRAASQPGSSNFANDGRRRGRLAGAVVVGVQLAQPVLASRSPSACRRTRATCSTRVRRSGFYGSELLAQASLQWSPGVLPATRTGSSSSTTRCPTTAGCDLLETGGGGRRVRLRARTSRRAPTGGLRARPRSPASRSATSSTCPTTPGSSPTCRLDPAPARQAAHPVLPGHRPRPRPPGHRGQPAGAQPRPGVHRAQPGARPASRREAGGDAAVAVRVLGRDDRADRLHRGRQGGDGLHRRRARPVGHEGQPRLQGHRAAARGVAAARRLRRAERTGEC